MRTSDPTESSPIRRTLDDMDTTEERMIVDLDESECLRLAASEPVGRLAWTGAGGPAIVPVNFALEDRVVHVRTAAYSAMARECDDSPVAFEVDAYDADNRLGWSVVLTGRGSLGFGPTDSAAPTVWPVGAKAVHLSIAVEKISGRRLKPR